MLDAALCVYACDGILENQKLQISMTRRNTDLNATIIIIQFAQIKSARK